MATALAAQLAQLAAAQPAQERYVKGKPSLLFDYQKAADVSVEQILNIARTGLEALVRSDKRFSPFTESLFSRSLVNTSREQLSAEENEALNINLAAFLRVLTNHFLATAAFQVLEYCIRRYKVHVYNVNDLLLCALPYHATPEFARLLVLLQLKGSAWEWLTPGQQSGAPPPREAIVRRCVNDHAVLRVVCQGAQAVGVPGFVSKTYLSFYAVLLCEIMAALPRVTEDLLTLLLPFLAAGLKGDASKEFTSATLMVLTQLLTRAQLSQDFLKVVMLDVVRSWSDLGGPTVLMMLAHLASTQPHCSTVPLKALQVLAQEHSHVAQELSDLQARQANLAPLLQLLLPSLTQALPANPGLEPLATALLKQVAVGPQLVQAAAVQLLRAGAAAQEAAAGQKQQPKQQHLQHVLRVFDLHYPDQLDAAINTALQEATAAAAAAAARDAEGSSGNSKAKKQKASKRQQHSPSSADALFEFVQTCFAGSRHEVLAAGDCDPATATQQQHQQARTLSLAVHAPASEMRVMALQKLDAVCGADSPASTRQLLQNSLLSGLRDDVLAVAAAAAAAKGLADVPGEQQLPALQYLLQRAATVIAAGHVAPADAAAAAAAADSSVGGAKEALTAARAALAAVAAVGEQAAAAGDAALQRQAAGLLLEYTLADKRCKKLSKTSVKVVLQCSWSGLLQAMSDAPAVAAALEGAAADAAAGADTGLSPASKRRKKSSKPAAAAAAAEGVDQAAAAGKHSGALALNRAVVAALADAVAADTASAADDSLVGQVEELLLSAAAGPRCRQLLLLVLANAAAAAAPGKGASKSAKGKGSNAAAADAAGSTAIAALLVRALECELAAAAAAGDAAGEGRRSGSKKAAVSVAAVLPGSWEQDASELLDSTHLPTKQHLAQLPTQLQHLNAVVLLSALHTALSAAPAAGLAQVLGQPVQLFARLAAATAGDAEQGAGLLQHLQLVVEKSGESAEQQLQFLSNIYGLPVGVAGAAVQAVALQLLPQVAAAVSGSAAWFVRLLAAANSRSKPVREAAVTALLALDSGSAQAALLPAAPLQELVAALRQHEQLLRGSAGALQRLLCSAVSGGAAAMDVDAPNKARRGSKTAAGKFTKGRASDDAAAAPAVLHLGAGAAAALQQLLRESLPNSGSDGDLLGVQLAVAVLVAGSKGGASAAEPAVLLLQQLLVRLCKQSPVAAKGAVWPQLVAVRQGAEAAAATGAAAAELQQLRSDLAVSLLQFFTPDVLQQSAAVGVSFVQLLQAPFSTEAAAAVFGSSSSSETGAVSAAQLAAVAPVRVAALQQLTPEAFAALQPQQQQQAAFSAALQTLASDGVAACRTAARQCLEQLPVDASMLLVLLQAVGASAQAESAQEAPPTQSKPKRARKGSGSQQQQDGVLSQDVAAAAAGQITTAALDAAVAALEFMQWRDDIPDRQHLAQPLQQLLRLVVPLMGSIAEVHQEEEADADAAGLVPLSPTAAAASADRGDGSNEQAQGVLASAAGYATQLVLLVLQQLVQEQLAGAAAAGAGSVDVELVLSCASAAPDGAVRNAALLLMAALGQLSPADVLEHVLKALAVIQHSAALQADAHSQAVASSTLAALVPAWLAAGRGSEELWGSLLAALPGLPAHRRLGLLESLLGALPEDKGLPVGLLLMMQLLVDLSTASRAAAAAAASPSPKGKKSKKLAVPEQVDPQAVAGSGDDQEAWLPELMASLCEKVGAQQRLSAFAGVLAASLSDSQGPVAAHEPLPRLAVSFVAANLKAKSVSSAITAARVAAQAGSPEPQVALQDSCQAIMNQGLQHLLQLNPTAAAEAAGTSGSSSKQARRLQKAISAAADGVYDLLSALEAVQDCPSYLLALVQMSKQPSDSVQRRALKLLADRLSKAQIDIADLESSTAQLPAAARQAAQQELAEAGLAVCVELPRLLAPSTPAITKQLALIAADAGIRIFGQSRASVVLASMLEVLKAVQDPSAPVRASALTCIAAGVSALGMSLVPLLPQTATAVLSAAEAAAQDLALLQQQQAAGGGSSSSDEEDSADAEDADEEEQQQQRQGKQDDDSGSGGAASLQLAGAVAALEALVTNLGAFVSPYLPRLLQLLLHRQVLRCTVADANAVAGRLRGALPVKVPSRLLLQPLLQQWEPALAACVRTGASAVVAAPAVALLDLVAAFCKNLQPAEAMGYLDQLAGLLLGALGTRSRWLAAAAGQQLPAAAGAVDAETAVAAAAAIAGFSGQQVWEVEAAAVRALAALVMKLSESRFKPMFLRMLDWTHAALPGADSSQQQQQGVGRVAALFGTVCIFSERLRKVFAPYYKYFFTLLMQQLAGDALAQGAGKRSKKKRKLSAAADPAAGGSDVFVLSRWLAQLRAVRAVHLLALHEGSHDTPAAQQEQQERFDKLMPLLVEVLQEGPSAPVAAELALQGADPSLDLPNSPVAALGAVGAAVVEAGGSRVMEECCDIVGTAAVGALVQIAVAGGSDVVWKPLHHALLLATRGGTTRAKLLALGGVSRLADLLREDYLNLLPEALGFIAELVEDGEVAVEAAAQGLLAQLEGLSGEKLEQYLKAG